MAQRNTRTLSAIGRTYNKTGILNRRLVDPFRFTKFGPYHKALFTFYFLIILYLTLTVETESFARFKQPYCAGQPSVKDFCSKECKRIQLFNDLQLVNYVTEYNLVCENDLQEGLLMFLEALFFTIGGIFCCMNANRHGRRNTMILGLILALITDIILLFCRKRTFVYFNTIFIAIYFPIIRFACTTMVFEMSPPPYAKLVIFFVYVSTAVGKIFTIFLWYFMRHWIQVYLVKFGLTVILLTASLFLPESPRWNFSRSNIKRSIKALRRIHKFNKDPTDDIQERVERCWRYQRSLPKPRDSFLGIFYYPQLTTILVRIIVTTSSFLMITVVGERESPEILIMPSHHFTGILNQLITIGVVFAWYNTLSRAPRKKTIVYGFVTAFLLAFILLCVRVTVFAWIFGKFVIVNILIVGLHLDLVILETFPTSLRALVLATENIFKKYAYILITYLYALPKVAWLPAGVAVVVALLGAVITTDLIDTKGNVLPLTSRDAELLIKAKRLGKDGNDLSYYNYRVPF